MKIDAIVDVNELLKIDGRCSEGGDGLTYRYDLEDGVRSATVPTVFLSWSMVAMDCLANNPRR